MYKRVIIYNVFAFIISSGIFILTFDIPLEHLLEDNWIRIFIAIIGYKLLIFDRKLTDIIKQKIIHVIIRIIIFLFDKYFFPYISKRKWWIKLMHNSKGLYKLYNFNNKIYFTIVYNVLNKICALAQLPKFNDKFFNVFIYWYYSLFVMGIIFMEGHTWFVIIMLHITTVFFVIYFHIRNKYPIENTIGNRIVMGILDLIVCIILLIFIYYSVIIIIKGLLDITAFILNIGGVILNMLKGGISVNPRPNGVDLGDHEKHFGLGPRKDHYFGVGGEFRGTYGIRHDICNPDMRNVYCCRDEYSNAADWAGMNNMYENNVQHSLYLEKMNNPYYTPEEKSKLIINWNNISAWRMDAKIFHTCVLSGDYNNPFILEFAKKDPYYALKVTKLVRRDVLDEYLKGSCDSIYAKICTIKAFKIGYNEIPYIANGDGTFSCKSPMFMYNVEGTLVGFIPPNSYTIDNIRNSYIPEALFNMKGFIFDHNPLSKRPEAFYIPDDSVLVRNYNVNNTGPISKEVILPGRTAHHKKNKHLRFNFESSSKRHNTVELLWRDDPLNSDVVVASSSKVIAAPSGSSSIGTGNITSQIPKDVFNTSLSSQITSNSVVDPRDLTVPSTTSNLPTTAEQVSTMNSQSSNNPFNVYGQVYGDPFTTSASREASPSTQEFLDNAKRIRNLKRKFSDD